MIEEGSKVRQLMLLLQRCSYLSIGHAFFVKLYNPSEVILLLSIIDERVPKLIITILCQSISVNKLISKAERLLFSRSMDPSICHIQLFRSPRICQSNCKPQLRPFFPPMWIPTISQIQFLLIMMGDPTSLGKLSILYPKELSLQIKASIFSPLKWYQTSFSFKSPEKPKTQTDSIPRKFVLNPRQP